VDNSVHATMGIGHTRWATHGVPSEDNAHPHRSTSGRFTLVHNGVIENYQEIKKEYLQDVNFVSETDTEVIVQLVEKLFAETGSTIEAFRKAMELLKGSYAIGLIDNEDEDTLYVSKNKSPLLVGLGDGFN
ncbi:class II glutamine amidotransferase, partial [Planococcus sp. SIMBA_143]